MVVSHNGGTPKSSISMGFSTINQPFLDIPIDGTPHINYNKPINGWPYQPRWPPRAWRWCWPVWSAVEAGTETKRKTRVFNGICWWFTGILMGFWMVFYTLKKNDHPGIAMGDESICRSSNLGTWTRFVGCCFPPCHGFLVGQHMKNCSWCPNVVAISIWYYLWWGWFEDE